jgi:hypothetical protein
MIILVNGIEAAHTSSSKITGIDSKAEAFMFEQAYQALGFTDVRSEAEYAPWKKAVETEEKD